MRDPHHIIAIHALIGTAVEAGGAIVDSHGKISAEELSEMISTFHRTIASLLDDLEPSAAPEPDEPGPKQPERLFDQFDAQDREVMGLPF